MPPIDVKPMHQEDIPDAAGLFIRDFSTLLESAPELAHDLADPGRVAGLLKDLFGQCSGLSAWIQGKLAGYLGWYLVPDFRGAGRLGAYIPEWGHSAASERTGEIHQALYNAASGNWSQAGCQVYAVTQLATNTAEREMWFWNGFGLLVVDAIRPMLPLEAPAHSRLSIRKATPADADALHRLDIEHRRHYTQPPILMATRAATTTEAFLQFINQSENSIWMAWDGSTPAGFIRFDAYEIEAATLLEGDGTAFISGAYVRPAYRKQGAARVMLDAALDDFSRRGYIRCVLDFESFNPEARAFWLKYFRPVAYSLMRVPETAG